MKLSLTISTTLLASLLVLTSCSSKSENSPQESTVASLQEQKKEDGPSSDDTFPDDEMTAQRICNAAFTEGGNSYFTTYSEQEEFKKFLGALKLIVSVETCKSFDDVAFSAPSTFVDLHRGKDIGRWINSFFVYMGNAKKLIISDESVHDISNIRFMHRLELLSLANTSASDLSPIKKLGNLEFISLEKTQITNESLKDLPYRRNVIEGYTLRIGNNPQITDISGLENVKDFIRGLSLRGDCNLIDFSPLAKFRRVSELDLSRTMINEHDLDEYVIGRLQFLRELNLANTDISNIEGLGKLEKLEKLNLTNTAVTNLDALRDLKNLKFLYLSKEQLDTLDLSKLPKHIQAAVLKEI